MARPVRKITIVRDGEPQRFVLIGDTVINTRHITSVQNRAAGGSLILAGGREYTVPDIDFSVLADLLIDGGSEARR